MSRYAVSVKGPRAITAMRESGRITAEILRALADAARPGVTTLALDELARSLLKRTGASSAFLGFEGYPSTLCTSVNEVAVHGLPSSKTLLCEGDIVGLDFGTVWKGYCADAAITVGVGAITRQAQRLLEVTKQSLAIGVAAAVAGNGIGDIGAAIQRHIESAGFTIVKELVGHGIGRELHEDPLVPNFGTKGAGQKLVPGMTIAIEPIVSAGRGVIRKYADGFGYETADRSPTAHFEHTVLITEGEPEIFTSVKSESDK